MYSVSKTVDEYGNPKQIESTGDFDPKTNILDRHQTQTITINGQQILEKEIQLWIITLLMSKSNVHSKR